jgi:hypothetical protein
MTTPLNGGSPLSGMMLPFRSFQTRPLTAPVIGVAVGVAVGVHVAVGVDVAVGDEVAVGVDVAVGVMVGVRVIVAVGVDVGLKRSPKLTSKSLPAETNSTTEFEVVDVKPGGSVSSSRY